MYSILKWISFALVFVPSVHAKACTSTQLTQLSNVASSYINSPDCAGSALDSSSKTVAVICAGACVELVRELQPDAPDCEYDGTNLGETMSELVAWCESASSSGSESTSTSGSTGSMLDFVPLCTIANVTLIDEINTEVSTSADCLGSAGAATFATDKTEYCDEDSCVAYLAEVKERLPNCTYAGYNVKQVVADTLALCEDPSLTWAPSTTPKRTPPPTDTIIPTTPPRVTTQTPLAGSSQNTEEPATITSAAIALKPGVSIAVAVSAVVIVLGSL